MNVAALNESLYPELTAVELIKLIDQLTLSERLKVIEHLLLRQPTSIVAGSHHLVGSVTFQINLVNSLDTEQIGDLLKVLSHRIATEGRPEGKVGPD